MFTARQRVLVIEDNPVNLELVTAILEDEDTEILSAETAPAGIALAVREQPQLILMDVQLPGMSGYDAARALKADARTARIPIIALTAHAMRGEAERAQAAGCDAYLAKPLDPAVLRHALSGHLQCAVSGRDR